MVDLTRKIRELYGLEKNPFPITGSFPLDIEEERYASIFVMSEKVAKKIEYLLKLLESKDRTIPFFFIVGDYGYGKTHFLKYMQYYIHRNIAHAYALYVKRINDISPLSIYRALIDSIFRTLGRPLIASIFKKARKLDLNVRDKIERLFPDLSNLIDKFAENDNLAFRWLIADEMSVDMLRDLNVVQTINDENAIYALVALLKIIYYTIGMRIVFLIDELDETLAGRSRKDIARFYDNMRQIVDLSGPEVSFIMAVSPGIFTGTISIKELSPALFSRVSELYIYLEKLSKDMLMELVKRYLREFRKPSVKRLYDPLFPFTEDAISKVHDITGGVPRNALMLLGKILDIGAMLNKRTIDMFFVSEVAEGKTTDVAPRETEDVKRIIQEAIEEASLPTPRTLKDLREYLKERIINALRKASGGTLTLSALARVVKSPYDLVLETCKTLHREGIVLLKRSSRGYRVYIRVTRI
mgnify:CR=1 FL=1